MRRKYLNKISGPLLDRIDIHLHVHPVKLYTTPPPTPTENSQTVRQRVVNARARQTLRLKNYPDIHCNAMMPPHLMQQFCKPNAACQNLLSQAIQQLNLSARAYDRILKLARTIADLEDSTDMTTSHIAEAIHFRSLDRATWAG